MNTKVWSGREVLEPKQKRGGVFNGITSLEVHNHLVEQKTRKAYNVCRTLDFSFFFLLKMNHLLKHTWVIKSFKKIETFFFGFELWCTGINFPFCKLLWILNQTFSSRHSNQILLTVLLSNDHSSRCKLKVYIIICTKEKPFTDTFSKAIKVKRVSKIWVRMSPPNFSFTLILNLKSLAKHRLWMPVYQDSYQREPSHF